VGAIQNGAASVTKWSEPLFEAFCEGAWIFYWTGDTLYWVAKPVVHKEVLDEGRRLHNESYAALESDVENMYFWHGVLVPAFVIVKPEWITAQRIRDEQNAEMRRAMVERMGWQRFVAESQTRVIHTDALVTRFPKMERSDLVDNARPEALEYEQAEETAELLESELMRDFEHRPLKFVRLTCPSTGRVYVQRAAHDETRVYAAVARSFGLTEAEYKSGRYLRQGDVLMWALDQSDERICQAHS
jgi:hypothetical protein